MTIYSYKAINQNGEIVKGRLNASDSSEAKIKLREDGLTVASIKNHTDINKIFNSFVNRKLSLRKVSLVCRQISIVVNSGINLITGLDIVQRQMTDKILKEIMVDMLTSVKRGISLSESMSRTNVVFPKLLLYMVKVGEESGDIGSILLKMSEYYENEVLKREKFKKAAMYPVVLCVMGTMMLIFFLKFIMPETVGMMKELDMKIPTITKIMLDIVGFISNYSIGIIVSIVAALFAIKAFLPAETVKLVKDMAAISTPILGKGIRNVITSRFLRTFSVLVKSGVPVLKSLDLTEKVLENVIAQKGIKNAIEGAKKGESIGKLIASCDFFDPMVTHMITIASESGELDNVLESMADHYEKESDIWINKMIGLAEPVFTIVIGIVIAVMVASVALPIIDSMSGTGIK